MLSYARYASISFGNPHDTMTLTFRRRRFCSKFLPLLTKRLWRQNEHYYDVSWLAARSQSPMLHAAKTVEFESTVVRTTKLYNHAHGKWRATKSQYDL